MMWSLREDFRRRLLEWYDGVRRDLPWRRTADPYAIWVSEIMLQQTRAAAVIPYYERFLERFPTPERLASAGEEELLGAWSGLGYYSRARNLHRAAQAMNGSFPATFEEIRSLPGVGDYTAAAIASIAFGLPYAAVDGNVIRVLSRVRNDGGDVSEAATRRRIAAEARDLLDPRRPGDFNQAMMELGATVCLPRQPQCLLCPVAGLCRAREAGTQNDLPRSSRRQRVERIERTLLIVEREGRLLLWQRAAESRRLAGFWELPEPQMFEKPPRARVIGSFRHSITNHHYTFHVAVVRPGMSAPCKQVVNCVWIARKALETMALSTTARKALAIEKRIDSVRAGIE